MDRHLYDARLRSPAALVIAAAAFALLVCGAALLGQGCAQKASQGPFAVEPPPQPDAPPPPDAPPDPITDPPMMPDAPPPT